ncbi:MAG: pseudouridine synthase [Pseudomonadota bacterium]
MSEKDPIQQRIAKVLARAGVASRRDVEKMIADQRISLHGSLVTSPATFIEDTSGITVDGKALDVASETIVYRYHKPAGIITTHKDPQGRKTVFDALPKSLGRVVSVGRLDLTSEGLLLLTNDGALAHALESPRAGITRTYRVRAHGRVDENALADLANGVRVDGINYGAIKAKLERKTGQNSWLSMALEEGKNREIRKVLAHLGLTVNRLIRTDYGAFSLGRLPREGVAIVPPGLLKKALQDMAIDHAGMAAPPESRRGWAKAKAKRKKPPAGRRSIGQRATRKPTKA